MTRKISPSGTWATMAAWVVGASRTLCASPDPTRAHKSTASCGARSFGEGQTGAVSWAFAVRRGTICRAPNMMRTTRAIDLNLHIFRFLLHFDVLHRLE